MSKQTPAAAHLSQIFLGKPGSPSQDDVGLDAHATALARTARQTGTDFAKLARRYSQDARSAPRGGDLGWIETSRFLPDIARAIDRLKPGEVAGPIQRPYGFHILKLHGRRPARALD